MNFGEQYQLGERVGLEVLELFMILFVSIEKIGRFSNFDWRFGVLRVLLDLSCKNVWRTSALKELHADF